MKSFIYKNREGTKAVIEERSDKVGVRIGIQGYGMVTIHTEDLQEFCDRLLGKIPPQQSRFTDL